jgi:hypothetical protein
MKNVPCRIIDDYLSVFQLIFDNYTETTGPSKRFTRHFLL